MIPTKTSAVSPAASRPSIIQTLLSKIAGFRTKLSSHPIDRQYGIKTTSILTSSGLKTGDSVLDRANVGYVSSQPSITRACLRLIPEIEQATFIDIGCGKGRAVVVATEFPFKSIVGVELSAKLARIAEQNVNTIRFSFPGRTPVKLVTGDATRFPLGGIEYPVFFFYNSFRAELVERLIAHLEAEARSRPDFQFMFIYYNPVHHHLFDASPLFQRFYAAMHQFEPEESAESPFANTYDSVVIYQSRSARSVPAHPGADARIVVTIPDLGADVVSVAG